jgi:GTPase SAR1 family protein
MPALKNHHSSGTTKLLFVGDSGAGKTGALASLAGAGFKIRILDLDNGVDVLRDLLSSGKYSKDAINNVEYVTITDPMKNVGGKFIPTKASVWQRVASMLSEWKDGETNLGSVSSWDNKTVLVIDSLTMLSDAALFYILAMNGRLGQQPHQSDWDLAQNLIVNLLRLLYDESVKCNVIINCHIKIMGGKDGPEHYYPNTLGKALPPKIGRYFNSILLAQSSGRGQNLKRQIFTTSQGTIECKNTAPSKVAQSYPLETGLADYFAAVRA